MGKLSSPPSTKPYRDREQFVSLTYSVITVALTAILVSEFLRISTWISYTAVLPFALCAGKIIFHTLLGLTGLFASLVGYDPSPSEADVDDLTRERVAMVMLVYNEDPTPVVQRLKHMYATFQATASLPGKSHLRDIEED